MGCAFPSREFISSVPLQVSPRGPPQYPEMQLPFVQSLFSSQACPSPIFDMQVLSHLPELQSESMPQFLPLAPFVHLLIELHQLPPSSFQQSVVCEHD